MNKSTENERISPAFGLFLKAALASGKTAETAFARWRETVDFDALDTDSYYLLPVLYLNQRNNPSKDVILKKIKGIYRRTWLENQIRIPHFQKVFDLFKENRIDFVVLSKTPLVWKFFDNTGIFSLDNFDLLIREEQILAVDKLLQKNDWRTNRSFAAEDSNGSLFYENKDFAQIIFRQSSGANYESIWKNAAEVEFCGTKIKTPSMNEQILSLGEARFGDAENNLWAFYFYLIFSQNRTEINWNELIAQAERRKMCYGLFIKLQFMQENFAVGVSEKFFGKLQKKAEAEIALPGKWRTALLAYRSLQKSYLDNLAENNLPNKPYGFVKFLRGHWQINSVLFIPWHIGKRFVKTRHKI